MKKYKCPKCNATKFVIRKTKRKQSILYYCKRCIKYFSINTTYLHVKHILAEHLGGLSFRDLGRKYKKSAASMYRICKDELKKLPNNNQFTHKYCNRFSSILVCDGKYVRVKGYDRKIPLLWGLDYFRHDIPFFVLASSENYQSWARYFSFFRIKACRPQLIVCDDNYNIKVAARSRFPAVNIQTCVNHFKENIRYELKVRSDNTYKIFSRKIDDILSVKHSDAAFDKKMRIIYKQYRNNPVAQSILLNIEKNKQELLGYRGIKQAPMTTNLIECFNSHLQDRLRSIKCFNTYSYAKLWLNGYILKRRYTRFTCCTGKFKRLNGVSGISQTKRIGIDLPILF